MAEGLLSTDHRLLAGQEVHPRHHLLGHGLPGGGHQHVGCHPGPGGSQPMWELSIVAHHPKFSIDQFPPVLLTVVGRSIRCEHSAARLLALLQVAPLDVAGQLLDRLVVKLV